MPLANGSDSTSRYGVIIRCVDGIISQTSVLTPTKRQKILMIRLSF